MPKAATIKVVRIATGEIAEAVVLRSGAVWKQEHLKKGGAIPANQYSDGWIRDATATSVPTGWGFNYMWGYYSPEREVEAEDIRVNIKVLEEALIEAKQKLLALYNDQRKERNHRHKGKNGQGLPGPGATG